MLATVSDFAHLSVTLSFATGGMPYIQQAVIACPTGMYAIGGGYRPSSIENGVQLQTSIQTNASRAWQLNLLVTAISPTIPPFSAVGFVSCVSEL